MSPMENVPSNILRLELCFEAVLPFFPEVTSCFRTLLQTVLESNRVLIINFLSVSYQYRFTIVGDVGLR